MSGSTFQNIKQQCLKKLVSLPLRLHDIGLGILFAPFPFIVLTTRGRHSGLPRHVVLEWRRHGSRYYLVSIGGIQAQWYKNILVDPVVTVQNGVNPLRARAYTVTDAAEALRALYMFRRHSPLYDYVLTSISDVDTIDFRTLTQVAGDFTVVRLEMEPGSPALPGIEARYPLLHWLPPLLMMFFGGMWWRYRRGQTMIKQQRTNMPAEQSSLNDSQNEGTHGD